MNQEPGLKGTKIKETGLKTITNHAISYKRKIFLMVKITI